MPANRKLPFQPIRFDLYSSAELAYGFDAGNPDSIAATMDFLTYQYFVKEGRQAPLDAYAGMMESLHDNAIFQAMFDFLADKPKKAAIMGGHDEERGTRVYRDVARLAKRLSEEGFLMASGGGPGAMEATHLGSLYANANDAELERAINAIATIPKLPPDAVNILDKEGKIIDRDVARRLHAWAAPAHQLMRDAPGGESLAVPTWYYGHEPVTPLATHVAKYFQNSIREDVLLLLAAQGIVYAPGRAGTMQEVFQDAAQNYYAGQDGVFSPMIFFDIDGFWSQKLPVLPILQALFELGGPKRLEAFHQNVHITEDPDEIVALLAGASPAKFIQKINQLGMRSMAIEANLIGN